MQANIPAPLQAEVTLPPVFYYTKAVHHEPYDHISPYRPELSARGKNVVVTGGGTGIGKAIAVAFAQAGAHSVSIVGRREDRLKEAVNEIRDSASHDASIISYRVTDLMKREQVDEAMQSIVMNTGKIDLLVSNAGVLQDLAPIVGYDKDEFMRGFDVNVLTAFNAVQAFLPHATPRPVIINISAGMAHMAPTANISGYAVSKAANLKMMDCFAAENPNLHIVNVQPGDVATEMSEKAGLEADDAVELPGHFCVWLASPEAEFLKSKFVWVNWDVGELIANAEAIKSSRLLTWVLDGVPM